MKRLKKIFSLLKREGADVLVIINHEFSGQPETRYLSGFSGSESLVVLGYSGRFIFVDGRYVERARREAPRFSAHSRLHQSPYAMLSSFLGKNLEIKSILLDGAKTYHGSFAKIVDSCPEIIVKNATGILEELRVRKEVSEIKLMRKSAHIAGRAFKKLLPLIRSGVSERFLAAKLEFFLKESGADKSAFDAIVASGKNGAYPHTTPTSKKLAPGELVTIDFGAYYRGYASDVTRTLTLGKPAPRLKHILEVVRKAQALGCAKARAGMTGAALDALCRNYIIRFGFGKYFTHATGHGIGMAVHELPSVSYASKKRFPMHSVVTCEPGIYVKGLGGARIEDMLVLGKSSADNLTSEIPHALS